MVQDPDTRPQAPLRIGILGASRIAPAAIIRPARALGHRLVAVAARDQQRAAAFAEEHGIERAYGSYAELLDDPEVEVVFNGLPNGLHGRWTLASIAAGKHTLVEKPFASNAAEAAQVRAAASDTSLVVMEAFHYLYHPLMLRVEELLDDGTIGRLVHADIDMVMPPPAPTDPRWSASLAGGSMMDVGCYGLHLARYLGRWGGGPPQVVRATARQSRAHPGVDAALTAHLTYPNGSTARVRSGMRHRSVRFAFRLRGTGGSLAAPAFVLPMNDDRIIVSNTRGRFLRPAEQRVERLGTTPTYHYQLAAFADAVSAGARLRNDLADAVAQMELIDEAYRAAGMSPRQAAEGGVSHTTA